MQACCVLFLAGCVCCLCACRQLFHLPLDERTARNRLSAGSRQRRLLHVVPLSYCCSPNLAMSLKEVLKQGTLLPEIGSMSSLLPLLGAVDRAWCNTPLRG